MFGKWGGNGKPVIIVPAKYRAIYLEKYPTENYYRMFSFTQKVNSITAHTDREINELLELSNLKFILNDVEQTIVASYIIVSGLTPNTTYHVKATASVGDDVWEEEWDITTKDISLSYSTTTTQTTATVQLKHNIDNKDVKEILFNGKKTATNVVKLTNLAPGKDYTYTYSLETTDGDKKAIDVKLTTKPISVNIYK